MKLSDHEKRQYALGVTLHHVVENKLLCLKGSADGDGRYARVSDVITPHVEIADIPDKFGDITLGEVMKRAATLFPHPLGSGRERRGEQFPFRVHRLWAPAGATATIDVQDSENAFLSIVQTFGEGRIVFDDKAMKVAGAAMVALTEGNELSVTGIEGYLIRDISHEVVGQSHERGCVRQVTSDVILLSGTELRQYGMGSFSVAVYDSTISGKGMNTTGVVLPHDTVTAVVPLVGAMILNLRISDAPPIIRSGQAALLPPRTTLCLATDSARWLVLKPPVPGR